MSETNVQDSNNAKEIRFAVVMYGGVSLAIYINGIAQELLKMCHATVEGVSESSLNSTDIIYRKLSYLLSNRDDLDKLAANLSAAHNSKNVNTKDEDIKKAEAEIEKFFKSPDNRPDTKFVVDVLTGTSAGGINAIFLAKALSNNQDITDLKQLWLNEGDIGVLINDKKSIDGTGLSLPKKAKSLLNSNRMYLKLLKAFDDMGADPEKDDRSPFIDELDLFVPTTDFRGTVIPLRLLDSVVEEKRFRQVFHFRYDENEIDAEGRVKNDFKNRNNPMLALAARATSSFPFAFEPMRLSQAVTVIEESFEDWREKTKNLEADCKEFFPKIIQKDGVPVEWGKRDLVDGGVLDNKPFSYAIDVLTKRRADFQVERKLIYIEPSPESFPNTKTKEANPPNVLENAVASLSSIPGYETIREDLEKLLERNRLIERVNLIIRSAELDVFEQLVSSKPEEIDVNPNSVQQGGSFWEKQGLEDIARLKGRAVLPYYRLRIAALTDDIARLVTQINRVDEKSEYFEAIRKLVKIWRGRNFGDYQKVVKPKGTVLAFLRGFDLIYRLRRLRFVQLKASRLYFQETDFAEELCERFVKFAEIRTETESRIEKENVAEEKSETKPSAAVTENPFVEENIQISSEDWLKFAETIDWKLCGEHTSGVNLKKVSAVEGELVERKPSEILYLTRFQTKSEYKTQIRRAVSHFQYKLGEVFKTLQKKSKELASTQEIISAPKPNGESANTQVNLTETINAINLGKEDLDKLLSLTEKNFINTDSENPEIKPIWDKFERQINAAADKLENSFKIIFDEARQNVDDIFNADLSFVELKGGENIGLQLILAKAVRGYLKHYYNNFDEYDQISFPIFYQTQVGESVKVDVMRISPKDAVGLIDEKESGKMKLAGESLFHFGAFLDRVWRWNDIMWGRLDGAERLITALLPDAKYKEMRQFLTRQAQVKILEEEFLSSNNEALQGVLAESLTKVSAGLKIQKVVEKIMQSIGDDTVKTKLGKVLATCLDKDTVYDFVQKNYEVEKQLEPKPLLQVISRSTKVTGDIFEGIADEKAQVGSQMRWIARLGRIFGGLVEVAAPQTVWYEFLKHGLLLLYLFEVVLLVGSTLFVATEVQQFAIVSLILTLLVHFIAILLNEYMSGRKFLNLVKFLLITLVALPAVTGVLFLFAFFYKPGWWEKINDVQEKSLADEYGWLRLLPLLIVIAIFAVTFIWKALRDRKFARERKILTKVE